ncbi:DUF924-domain-containing protein [Daldinia eschscholtzii]|nr:DUF924-domain-containing protein [Daldinia eschscholtzii]
MSAEDDNLSVAENLPSKDSQVLCDASNIEKLLAFWFEHSEGIEKWFKLSLAVDVECKPWEPLVVAAQEGRLSSWSQSTDGTLALLLLMDQLPRNIYRGTPRAYASDAQALATALDAIARGVDRQVPLERQMFFYLPIMHHESLLAQVGCLGLYQGMLARAEAGTDLHELLEGALGIAQLHVDVIRKFGRFPGRNVALGRASTTEETEYLKDKGPGGF